MHPLGGALGHHQVGSSELPSTAPKYWAVFAYVAKGPRALASTVALVAAPRAQLSQPNAPLARPYAPPTATMEHPKSPIVPYSRSTCSSMASDDAVDAISDAQSAPPARRLVPLTWPRHWSMQQPQFTGSHPTYLRRFGLIGKQWARVRGVAWDPLREVLEEQQHEEVKQLSGASLVNIEETARAFYGFLVNVRGMAPKQGCNPARLTCPWDLNAFWKFSATPKALGGRGLCRSMMRLTCNCVQHLLVACEAAGVEPIRPPLEVRAWWKAKAQPRCSFAPQGARTTAARGQPQLWPLIQDAVKGDMGDAAEAAEALRDLLACGEEVSDEEIESTLTMVLRGCLLGPCGITSPPMRPACAPTLQLPGNQCVRLGCTINADHVCPGNTHEVVRDDEAGNDTYSLVWRHFKNGDKGGYVGAAAIVTHKKNVTGEAWQQLFGMWVEWARDLWFERVAYAPPTSTPYTYVDRLGHPWKSPESPDGRDLSRWLQKQLHSICMVSELFDE